MEQNLCISDKLLVRTAECLLQEVVDVCHADTDFLYNLSPDPPFALNAIKHIPVPILILEIYLHLLHLLLVMGGTTVKYLRAVMHQVRPKMRGKREDRVHFMMLI